MKSLDEFVELFADLFDDTDPSQIKADTNFRNLDEWSSLLALSVIALADDEFDTSLKGCDINSSKTVGDIYNRIIEKL